MARAGKLKVYRTAIEFHDAYVAASNQKTALEAWGSDKDLFARGVAEIVADAALTEEPLASPGKVIKRLRGTADEQTAALPADNHAPPNPKLKPSHRPTVPPDRASRSLLLRALIWKKRKRRLRTCWLWSARNWPNWQNARLR